MSQQVIVEKGIYCHSKTGNLYEVLGSALHVETNELLILYRPLYKNKNEFFVRPIDIFTEIIKLNGEMKPRFEKVEDRT